MSTDKAAEKIGARLRTAREARGLSQAALAEELTERTGSNYLHTTIGKIEKGTRTLSLIEAVHLSDVLAVEWAELFDMLKPSSGREDLRRVSIALESAARPIQRQSARQVELAAILIKKLVGKFGDSRLLNEPEVNEALDAAEDDLETLRSCYGQLAAAVRELDRVAGAYDVLSQTIEHGERPADDEWFPPEYE